MKTTNFIFFLALGLINFKVEAAGIRSAQDYDKALSTSPYSSCKGVKMLSGEDFEKNSKYWIERCNRSGENIQILPKSGMFVTEIQNLTASLALLMRVGEKAQEIMNLKIKEKEKVLSCFQSTKSNDASCEQIRKKEINSAYNNIDQLRLELALSEGKDPVYEGRTRAGGGHLVFPKAADLINSSLSKKFFGTVGVFRAEDMEALSPGEKFVAENKMQEEIDKIQSDKNLKDDSQKLAVFKQVRATHKARYLELLQDTPVLTLLGKLPSNRMDDKAINEAFSNSYSKLLKLAKDERAKMGVAWSHASVSPLKNGQRGYRAKDDEGRAKELLSFMAFEPIVDQVIKEQISANPNICSVASGLLSSMENSEFRSSLGTGAAVIVGAVAITAVTGGAGALILPELIPAIGGMALSAQTASALALGPGLGYLFRKDSQNQLDSNKGLMSVGLKDAKAVDKADAGVVIGNATMGLDFVGAGLFKGAGNAIYKSLAKNALKTEGLSENEAVKLISIAQSGQSKSANEAQKRINDSINKKMSEYFPERSPSPEEVSGLSELEKLEVSKRPENIKDFFNRIQKDDRKEVMTEAIKLLQKVNPESFSKATPKELNELNRQVVAIARYGDVKDPEKIAVILSQWDKTAKQGLANVYDDANKILNDKNFMKGTPLKERREQAFKKSLENNKVKGEQQINSMCVCANVCNGGLKTNTSFLNLKPQKNISVCVNDQKTTWYHYN